MVRFKEIAQTLSYIGAAFMLGGTVMSCVGCSDQPPVDIKSMMGKTKQDVLDLMGKPKAEEWYDNAIPDPSQHTQAEMDQWLESTPCSGLVYDDVVIQFNVHDKVVTVTKRDTR